MKYYVYQTYFDCGRVHVNIREVSDDYKPKYQELKKNVILMKMCLIPCKRWS